MERKLNVSTGIRFGLILGAIYCVLLFWRWSAAGNVVILPFITILSYFGILGLMFYEAAYRRKINGGFISVKDLFQTLFISVLLFEMFFSAYNYIHFHFIDTHVVDKMKEGMKEALLKMGPQISDQVKKDKIDGLDQFKDTMTIGQIIKNYFVWVSASGVFALIISVLMRKNPPAAKTIN